MGILIRRSFTCLSMQNLERAYYFAGMAELGVHPRYACDIDRLRGSDEFEPSWLKPSS